MTTEDITKLLELPWATLVMLASGYIGYFIANTGLKQSNKTIDVIFTSCVYGLLATLSYKIVIDKTESLIYSTIAALLTSIIFSSLWRRWIKRWFYKCLHKTNISHTDNNENVLSNVFDCTDTEATQLIVYLENGRILMSDELCHFKDLPNGPYTLGINGDVLMYVTDEKHINRWKHFDDVISPNWGYEITYIPADKINRISMRRK